MEKERENGQREAEMERRIVRERNRETGREKRKRESGGGGGC